MTADILKALKAGERLTALDGLTRFQTMCLHQRVSEFRAAGEPIRDEKIIAPSGKKIKRYFYAPSC